jgi:cephalosporin-C deacetylase
LTVALFDLPLEKLRTFHLDAGERPDFDAFWQRTLAESAGCDLDVLLQRVEHPGLKLVEGYDITFGGYRGQPVRGWFLRPAGACGPLPCLVHFQGYGGGRGLVIDWLHYPVAGMAVLVMDTRGQGSAWSPGVTADPEGSGPAANGMMTRGIDSPDSYYYRRVYVDAVRAVAAAGSIDGVDASRIGVTGCSQGGGIAIAAAALMPKQAKLLMADVPFLCGFRRATEIINTNPYAEISTYCKCHRDRVEQVFETLSYFDGVNLARRIEARSLFSAALMDDICPPSTVFAAYNNIPHDRKDIRVYSYNGHEGGASFQLMEKLTFATRYL